MNRKNRKKVARFLKNGHSLVRIPNAKRADLEKLFQDIERECEYERRANLDV